MRTSLSISPKIKHSRSPSAPRRKRQDPEALHEPALTPDEQSELITRLRYGIGLEQLGVPRLAHVTPARPPQPPADPPRSPRSDAEVRSRAAALGIAAGRRG